MLGAVQIPTWGMSQTIREDKAVFSCCWKRAGQEFWDERDSWKNSPLPCRGQYSRWHLRNAFAMEKKIKINTTRFSMECFKYQHVDRKCHQCHRVWDYPQELLDAAGAVVGYSHYSHYSQYYQCSQYSQYSHYSHYSHYSQSSQYSQYSQSSQYSQYSHYSHYSQYSQTNRHHPAAPQASREGTTPEMIYLLRENPFIKMGISIRKCHGRARENQ